VERDDRGQAPADGRSAPAQGPGEATFEDFYRAAYRGLLKIAIYAGGSLAEAEDAVSAAMEDVLQRWADIRHPRAYARQAVVSHLVRERTRGLDRVRRRQAQLVPAIGDGADAGPAIWEDRQWVLQLLARLPPAQREVMALVVDGFTAREMAVLLGKSPGAVRQNLMVARQRLSAAVQDDHRGGFPVSLERAPETGRSADEA
jgi:RNA polymerase sigma factor (sigma-70 family)